MRQNEAEQLSDLVTNVEKELAHVKDLLEEFSMSCEGRKDAPKSLAAGTYVRAFAECADRDGNALLGDLSVVVEAADPESFSTRVVIEVLRGPSEGMKFHVLPQQCIIVDADSSEKENIA